MAKLPELTQEERDLAGCREVLTYHAEEVGKLGERLIALLLGDGDDPRGAAQISEDMARQVTLIAQFAGQYQILAEGADF